MVPEILQHEVRRFRPRDPLTPTPPGGNRKMHARKRLTPTPTQRAAGKKARPQPPAHARDRAALPFRLPLSLLTTICVAQLLILTILFYVSH